MNTNRRDIVSHCWFVGANFEQKDLSGRDLRGYNFTNANLRAVDLSNCDLRGAKFIKADLSRACLYNANCREADFSGADMTMSYLRAADFSYARMWFVALRRVTAKSAFFLGTDMTGSDFVDGFFLGSRFGPPNAILDMARNLEHARFSWWLPESGDGKPSYVPKEGYYEANQSFLGGVSLQENAARRPR